VEGLRTSQLILRDGLIAAYKGRNVRVRISDQLATIAIKGAHRGLARAEYEYEIPLAEAEAILSKVCPAETLENSDILWSTRGRYGMSMSMAAFYREL
jgi:CYTH domain-containing protein